MYEFGSSFTCPNLTFSIPDPSLMNAQLDIAGRNRLQYLLHKLQKSFSFPHFVKGRKQQYLIKKNGKSLLVMSCKWLLVFLLQDSCSSQMSFFSMSNYSSNRRGTFCYNLLRSLIKNFLIRYGSCRKIILIRWKNTNWLPFLFIFKAQNN